MSNAEDARLSELDGTLDAVQVSPQVGEELFAVVDLLDQQPSLRRALTDPGSPAESRAGLVDRLFGSRLGPQTLDVLRAAVRLRWGTASELVEALDRQAVRAVLIVSEQAGTLDTVEDELFRFERLVAGDAEVRAALGNRTAPLSIRRQLVAHLLATRVDAATNFLAQRAVAARSRNFEATVAGYLAVAAALRDRAIAHVVVAQPLSDDQSQRLAAALSRQLGRAISLQVEVHPGVIGGAQVRVGNEIIDATIAGRLEEARRRLG